MVVLSKASLNDIFLMLIINYEAREKTTNRSLSQIHNDLKKDLQNYVNGYDFELVLTKYFEGFESGNDELMDASLRWLYGEFTEQRPMHNGI